MHPLPATIPLGQLLVCEKSPVAVIDASVSGPVPVLVKVTTCAPLLVPCNCELNVRTPGSTTALGTVPVAGIALLLGVDRFLSEMRSVTNIIGNGVATIVISRWEGQFDGRRARAVLSGTQTAVEDDVTLREHAGVM